MLITKISSPNPYLSDNLIRFHYDIIPSTQIIARQEIDEKIIQDSNKWYLWTANGQSHGIGQQDRKWHTPYKLNINATYGFFLAEDNITSAVFIQYIAGLSVVQVLQKYNLQGKIKWVNDILINKKKVCGILVENRGKDPVTKLHKILIGIGINVNSDKENFLGINQGVTSIKIESGLEHNLEDIVLSLSNKLRVNIKLLIENKFLFFYNLINHHLEKFNHLPIILDTQDISSNRYKKGTIKGLGKAGELLLLIEGEKEPQGFYQGRIIQNY